MTTDVTDLPANLQATHAVARGVVWLDANIPEWRHTVTISELNLESPCRCILGQLFADNDSRIVDELLPAGIVEEFGPTHAEKMLAQFGQGYFAAVDCKVRGDAPDFIYLPEPVMTSDQAEQFGFDYPGPGSDYGYDELQAAWENELAIPGWSAQTVAATS